MQTEGVELKMPKGERGKKGGDDDDDEWWVRNEG